VEAPSRLKEVGSHADWEVVHCLGQGGMPVLRFREGWSSSMPHAFEKRVDSSNTTLSRKDVKEAGGYASKPVEIWSLWLKGGGNRQPKQKRRRNRFREGRETSQNAERCQGGAPIEEPGPGGGGGRLNFAYLGKMPKWPCRPRPVAPSSIFPTKSSNPPQAYRNLRLAARNCPQNSGRSAHTLLFLTSGGEEKAKSEGQSGERKALLVPFGRSG